MMARDHTGLALACERLLARGHFVDNRAKGEDIRPGIRLFAFQLLGRHVVKRSENRPLCRDGVIHQWEAVKREWLERLPAST